MKRAKTLFVSLAAGALALSLLTSCSGMEYPSTSPGGHGSNGTGGTSSGTMTGGNGSSGNQETPDTSGSSSSSSSSSEPEKELDPNENLEAYRAEVLRLINQARAEEGLEPLKATNTGLTELAQERAELMPESYRYCHEWPAMGYSTPEQLVNMLRRSDKVGSTAPASIYRENITQIGIGFYYNKDSKYKYYWDLITGDEYYPINTAEEREAYRQEVLDELNKVRAEKNLPLLKLDAALTETAQLITDNLSQAPEDLIQGTMYSVESIHPQEAVESFASGIYKRYVEDASYTVIGVGISTTKESMFISKACIAIDKESAGSNTGSTGNKNDSGTSSGQDEENSASLDQLSPNTVAYRNEVLRLVNIERKKAGLNELTMTNTNLLKAAQRRANEIAVRYNPPHTRLDGRSWSTVLAEYNVFWRATGENMAAGYQTPAEVVEGWMNSPGHRANILNENFNQIGIGYAYRYGTGYNHYWIQIFTN
mgnify:CR=1 FL=1